MKTVESTVRTVNGAILDDSGFDPIFHNGYEVVKVTLNYETNERFVSLKPLIPDMETLGIKA
ncbi:hypothetical protein GWK91_01885 [Virgibacillus sp. MSP4-1]|uniref:hypothetical protein n=1 Tax=Virgibacillus sp. MSP4-1 TaxID=2700081 RepID=UPI00039DFC1D|nr:hypothetical protein [Virgibacillus sp. MSP4-1]QHS21767.1 hypothetical protein GWK91_01885 [Virgibacillus sp. MSP4-1]